MIDVTDTTNRILDLFKAKSIDLKSSKISKELSDLVNVYGMNLSEAERTITGKYAKENNVIIYTNARSSAIRDVSTLKTPNEWVTVEGKCISANKVANTNKIFMKAVIADRTGAIPVTLWSRKAGEPMLPEMKEGNWYRISNVVVNLYKDILSLSVVKTGTVEEITEKDITDSEPTPIKDVGVGIFNLKCKVIQLFESKSDKISQVGLIGDESGIIKFIAWKSSNLPAVEVGKAYLFTYVQSQKYNDKYSVTINEFASTTDEITVPSKHTEIIGNLVSIKAGSGLIRRCTVENCGRSISRQNYCTIHEMQTDFKYDMRIKGVIDDGITAHNVIITLPTVEKMSGILLADAIKIAETNPLGADEVFYRITNLCLGRYFIIKGSAYPDRIFVNDADKLDYKEFKKITDLHQTAKQTSITGDA